MIEENDKYDHKRSEIEFYNLEQTARIMEQRSNPSKERAYAQFALAEIVDRNLSGNVLELGGGPGVMSVHFKEILGNAYLHSDLSPTLVKYARQKGLESLEVDALRIPFDNDSLRAVIAIGLSTLIYDAVTRKAQFKEVFRTLRPGGIAVFGTPIDSLKYVHRHRIHGLNSSDCNLLRALGYNVARVGYFGLVPAKLWKGPLAGIFAPVDRIASKFSIGIRKIIVCEKT